MDAELYLGDWFYYVYHPDKEDKSASRFDKLSFLKDGTFWYSSNCKNIDVPEHVTGKYIVIQTGPDVLEISLLINSITLYPEKIEINTRLNRLTFVEQGLIMFRFHEVIPNVCSNFHDMDRPELLS